MGWGGDGRRKYSKRTAIHADNHVYIVFLYIHNLEDSHISNREKARNGRCSVNYVLTSEKEYFKKVLNIVEPVEFVLEQKRAGPSNISHDCDRCSRYLIILKC